MAQHIAHVEIEFDNLSDQDSTAVLRRHLEAMLVAMCADPLIDHPHYHLLHVRHIATVEIPAPGMPGSLGNIGC